MHRNVLRMLLPACFISLCIAQGPVRPPITALDHVTLYSESAEKSDNFYVGTLHARKVVDAARPGITRYYLNSLQYVETLPLPGGGGEARLAAVGFATKDAQALRIYLKAHGVPGLGPLQSGVDGESSFTVQDAENNAVVFSQAVAQAPFQCYSDVTCHMIHTGFLVRDRSAEDRFYIDTLGFRPYWQGAMTPGKVDWVSQQVTNGSEWLEYMMTGPASDHPLASVTPAELGGMDHISLAVDNMEAVVTKLLRERRLTGRYNGPQMGRDGKWQTNLYDPDGTRVELMEPSPSIEPCCSPYHSAHPGLLPGLR